MFLRVDPISEILPWDEVHGEALQKQPTALDLFGVLTQSGIVPDVEVVEQRIASTFDSAEEALPQVRHALSLPPGPDSDGRLLELIRARLVRQPDGRLGPPLTRARSAILSWQPEHQA